MKNVDRTTMPLRFAFLRTYKPLSGGGPIPPVGLLYLTSVLRGQFNNAIENRLFDTGIEKPDAVLQALCRWQPDYVGFSVMSCEADLMTQMARSIKAARKDVCTIVGGPHASVSGERLLDNPDLDFAVFGEGEKTLPALIAALEERRDVSTVEGIAYRRDNTPVRTSHRAYIDDLDEIPFPAWDLVDFASYSARPTWVGSAKENMYAPIVTTRGCPYNCIFCHNMFGKRVRKRSAQNVIDEIALLHDRYKIREFHVIDDVFNIDPDRSVDIGERIKKKGWNLSLAFPNGLRADIMTEEVLDALKNAGTYKINYGFETTSARLQKRIGKNLDVGKARETIRKTSRRGIITGAYFMFGLPDQTREEIMETIDYAAGSELDVAFFFKATPYPQSAFHDLVEGDRARAAPDKFADCHFYSVDRSYGLLDTAELNSLILLAQQRFYLRLKRLGRGFFKAPRKMEYFKNVLRVAALVLQSYLMRSMTASNKGGEK